jgi:hypothetical protein
MLDSNSHFENLDDTNQFGCTNNHSIHHALITLLICFFFKSFDNSNHFGCILYFQNLPKHLIV